VTPPGGCRATWFKAQRYRLGCHIDVVLRTTSCVRVRPHRNRSRRNALSVHFEEFWKGRSRIAAAESVRAKHNPSLRSATACRFSCSPYQSEGSEGACDVDGLAAKTGRRCREFRNALEARMHPAHDIQTLLERLTQCRHPCGCDGSPMGATPMTSDRAPWTCACAGESKGSPVPTVAAASFHSPRHRSGAHCRKPKAVLASDGEVVSPRNSR
jgi:hypothetical protein